MFLQKLTPSRDGSVKSTENTAGMKTQEDYPATTPLQSVWSIALSATTVECERFIYLFIYRSVESVR